MDKFQSGYARSEALRYYEGPDNPESHRGEWRIRLNRYQRDNLLFVFALTAYADPDHKGLWPFTMLNSGDWAGEIPQELAKPTEDGATYYFDDKDRANAGSIDNVRTNLINNLAFKLHHAITGERATWSANHVSDCIEDGHLEIARKIIDDRGW